MPGRKRKAVALSYNGMGEMGAGVRPVPEIITMTTIPSRCACTWSPLLNSPPRRTVLGWRLKFRHAACPAYTSGEHA